jgi:ParB family chromosome partitioning protein
VSKTGALGKGMEALFGAEVQSVSDNKSSGKETYIDIKLIKANPDQPRKEFNQEALEELSESIRQQGIIQPILLEDKGGEYLIIAGERRFRAAGLAGLKEVPAIVRKYTEEEKLEIALIENIQREDLNPIEVAAAYKKLMNVTGLNQEELSVKVGKKRSTVANSLRLLRLPEDMQQAISDGTVSAGHARAILSVINPSDQRILFSKIVQEGLSVRQAETMAGDLNSGKRMQSGGPAKKPEKKSYAVTEIEEKLINRLGTKVSIRGDEKKGKIEINYFSGDDLERIHDLILGRD